MFLGLSVVCGGLDAMKRKRDAYDAEPTGKDEPSLIGAVDSSVEPETLDAPAKRRRTSPDLSVDLQDEIISFVARVVSAQTTSSRRRRRRRRPSFDLQKVQDLDHNLYNCLNTLALGVKDAPGALSDHLNTLLQSLEDYENKYAWLIAYVREVISRKGFQIKPLTGEPAQTEPATREPVAVIVSAAAEPAEPVEEAVIKKVDVELSIDEQLARAMQMSMEPEGGVGLQTELPSVNPQVASTQDDASHTILRDINQKKKIMERRKQGRIKGLRVRAKAFYILRTVCSNTEMNKPFCARPGQLEKLGRVAEELSGLDPYVGSAFALLIEHCPQLPVGDVITEFFRKVSINPDAAVQYQWLLEYLSSIVEKIERAEEAE